MSPDPFLLQRGHDTHLFAVKRLETSLTRIYTAQSTQLSKDTGSRAACTRSCNWRECLLSFRCVTRGTPRRRLCRDLALSLASARCKSIAASRTYAPSPIAAVMLPLF